MVATAAAPTAAPEVRKRRRSIAALARSSMSCAGSISLGDFDNCASLGIHVLIFQTLRQLTGGTIHGQSSGRAALEARGPDKRAGRPPGDTKKTNHFRYLKNSSKKDAEPVDFAAPRST
jgi:hypothetical protein